MDFQGPDGGYGWLIVFGSFLAHFMIVGMGRTFGVFYLVYLKRFGHSAAVTAWIGGVFNTMRTCFAPLSGYLAQKYSCRVVVCVGGFMLALGVGLTSVADDIVHIFLSYGVIGGFGGSMIFTPSYIIVSHYFEKRKGIAMSLATMGSGLGTLVLSLAVVSLLRHYGYFGTMLVLSGVTANVLVAGALLRPLRIHNMGKRKASQVTAIETEQGVSAVKTEKMQNGDKCEDTAAAESAAKDSAGANDVTSVCATIPVETVKPEHCICVPKSLRRYLSVLKRIVFIFYCFKMLGMQVCLMGFIFFVPAVAMEYGIPESSAVLLLSIFSFSDMGGRLLFGVFFDVKRIRSWRCELHACLGMIMALVSVLPAVVTTYNGLIGVCVVMGIVEGGYHSQRAAIPTEFLPRKHIPSTAGFVIFAQGVANTFSSYLQGRLRDAYKTYKYGFYYHGVTFFITCLMFLIVFMVTKRQRRNKLES